MTVAWNRTSTDGTLPVVDLTGLLDAAASQDAAVLGRIGRAFDDAFRAYGFCYVANHGIEPGLIERAFAAHAAFHALPLEEKMKVRINRAHRGYMPLATSRIITSTIETPRQPNLSESFLLLHEVAPGEAAAPLDGPNQWPERPPEFRPAVEAYDRALRGLAEAMTRMIAVALGLAPTGLDRYFARPTTFLRLLHYPPQPPDAPDGQYGSTPHTDYGFITILAQDEAGGLEVRRSDGTWIDAAPRRGTFVVNVGDIGSRWTNGRWQSTPHRVLNRSGRDRYSMPFFYDPSMDATIEPLPSCVSEANPPRFTPVKYGDYLMYRLDANYAYRREPAS